MATIYQSLAELRMTQGCKFTEKIALARIECDIAKRTLGTLINPQGKMKNIDPTLPSEYSVKD